MSKMCNGDPVIALNYNQTQLKSPAICVRKLCKSYGSKRKPLIVLDKLDMLVPKGVIYGLLGSSGCGKTTLINCLVGLQKANSGSMTVLDTSPSINRSGILGHRIAFMPQEIALYHEFSIRETMKYFGWIAGMKTKEISQKLQFLAQLLMIPNLDEKIKNLSGGQQRRVSFATALLHESELLILDEPTVGLDPILKETIWNHLVYITKSQQHTVVITTHYIEETRQANIIGLMRGGYIVAEESPNTLLSKLGSHTLQDAFLKLSLLQSKTCKNGTADPCHVEELCDVAKHHRFHYGSINKTVEFNSTKNEINYTKALHQRNNHLKAILWKNLLWMFRNMPLMASIIALPAVIIGLFCVSFGHQPYDFNISVVNYETNVTSCSNFDCDSHVLSCHYLEYLKTKSINLVYCNTEEEARELLQHGRSYASVIIPQNYSEALKLRLEQLTKQKLWNINYSSIEVINDISVAVIRDYIKKSMYDSFSQLLSDYSRYCNETSKAFGLPIMWKTPIYGIQDADYTGFASPGLTLTLIFVFSAAMSACSLLIERNEGILERSLIMSVNGIELLISHIICDSGVLICQIFLILVCGFTIFSLTLKGSAVLVFALCLLTGFCGMSFGFALSSIVENETAAVHIVTGIATPLVLLSGIVWPIEAMHKILKMFASIFPLTVATESMRSILQRGWNLYEPQVYYGFTYMSILSLMFLITSIIFLKMKHSF